MISIWPHLDLFLGGYNSGKAVRYYFDKQNRLFLSLADIESLGIELSENSDIVPVINIDERDIMISFLEDNNLGYLLEKYNNLESEHDLHDVLNIKDVLVSGYYLHDEWYVYKSEYIQESISNWAFDNRIKDIVVGRQPFYVHELHEICDQYSLGWGLRNPPILLEAMLRSRIEHVSEERLSRQNREKRLREEISSKTLSEGFEGNTAQKKQSKDSLESGTAEPWESGTHEPEPWTI